jgi:hypothetical protein
MNNNQEGQNLAVMMIEFGVTRQPQSYQSVRCGVTLPVFVQPGDDVHALLQHHLMVAKAQVRAEVDDEFERGHESPAPYSLEPRYQLMLHRPEKLALIIPEAMKETVPEAWMQYSNWKYGGHRLVFILQKVAEEYPGYTVVDLTNGDLEKLPAFEEFVYYRYRGGNDEPKLRVLAREGDKFEARDLYPGYWPTDTYFQSYATLVRELMAKAASEGGVFFDCTDGDFSTLPPPAAPAQEPEDEVPFGNDEDEEWRDDDDD